MRSAPVTFSAIDESASKAPRFVVAIMYEVDSLYITSHTGIAGVPGTVLDGSLAEPSIVSQRLKPDEAAAEIGSASFSLVDVEGSFTSEIRERLNDGAGLRGKTVRFYLGYDELPFEDFQLIGTQVVNGASYSNGKYSVSCLDIQRALRSEVFELVTTTLGATVLPGDTTITLTSTSGLQRVQHGPSFSDAPGELVGYIKIKTEVIRYSGIAGNQLTGCVRGVFNTTAAQYIIDPATAPDRREKVSEYVYLELPAIKLAYAVLTGNLHGSANSLPPKWHLGIDPDLVTLADFVNIGRDIWHPGDDTAGFVVRFEGLSKQDGKRFLEKEIYLLTGVYSPVYADGTLGLRRSTAVREDAATIITLDDSNSVQVGDLVHDMSSVHNAFVVNWSWNGEEYRRATAYIDTASRTKHGAAETYTLNFKGLHGGRHTDGVVFQMLDMIRDRYAGPPIRTTVDIVHSLNKIEVGDIVRGRWSKVRDFTGQTFSIDRAFEVQNVSVDHRVGKVSVELFGSTAEATANAPTSATVSLPDGFYTGEGTALASAPGITIAGNILTAASSTLAGAVDMNASGAIYYHDGDLTIASDVVLNIAGNVQLRVRGFLQINGQMNGKGQGHAGIADDGRALAYPAQLQSEGPVPAESIPGTPGYVGTTRGFDGIFTRSTVLGTFVFGTRPPHLTTGANVVAPRLLLAVNGASLTGIAADMRGGGGAPGGRLGSSAGPDVPTGARGGSGANGGAGLVIVCRGMAIGASGSIELSGDDSAATPMHSQTVSGTALQRYAGAGAGGGPGTCYVLLDGSNISVPDFSGNKFRAKAGATPVPDGTNALPSRRSNAWASAQWNDSGGTSPRVYSPLRGYDDPDFYANNAKDYSGSALVVQYVPGDEVAIEDGVDLPPSVYALTTESIEQGINVYLELPPFNEFDSVQVYASIDNNIANAVKVGEGKFDTFRVRVPDGAARRFWARTKNANGVSAWFPEVDGVLGQALGGLIARGGGEAYGSGARKPASVGAGWNVDIYSAETYAGGAFVSFQAAQTGAALMVGLNSDPESDSNYTSLDYAWAPQSDGVAAIYESGVLIGTYGAYTTNTVFAIKYDGQQIQYFKDGGLIRTVQRTGAAFFIDSSFNTSGGAIKSLKYGPLTTAPSIPWVTRGQCSATSTAIKKEGGANAWDSDAYSFEAYRNGAFVSFQCDQTNLQLMVGLNVDPATDQTYTGLDYAWYPSSDGNANIYESGVAIGAFGAYTTSTVFAIAYDGKTVRYLKNGVLVREVYSPDRTFHFDSSFANPGASIRNITFTPYGAATPVPFVSRSPYIMVSDTTAQKTGGSNAWDADFVSINGYPQAFVEFKVSALANLMVGLNSDPYTDQNFTSIDAAWHAESGGAAIIYENGVSIGTFGTYTSSTVFAITYDGTSFRYYKDGALMRTVSNAGLTVFCDASIHTVGGAINSLRFGPGTSLAVLDTPQLRYNAVSRVYINDIASLTTTHGSYFADISFTADFAGTLYIKCEGDYVQTTLGIQYFSFDVSATGAVAPPQSSAALPETGHLSRSHTVQIQPGAVVVRCRHHFKSPAGYPIDWSGLQLSVDYRVR